jgi:uncharacterized protein
MAAVPSRLGVLTEQPAEVQPFGPALATKWPESRTRAKFCQDMSELLYALPVDPTVPPPPAEVVNKLDVSQMEPGIKRVFVELVGDGLATGVRVPVLVARGRRPGPTVGLTACVHGNELNGIPVIHELFRELDIERLRGTIVGVVAVNVPGLHMHQREFVDGSDLNRIMPGNPVGSVAQVYAHRLLERIVSQFNYLLDLHTASFGRVNSLYVRADMTDQKAATMAYLQRPQIIVHNTALDHTLRGAAMQLGTSAITIEIGDPQRWQPEYTRSALAGVRAVLNYAGSLEASGEDTRENPDPVLCRSSSWMYTDRGGLLEVYAKLAHYVEQGEWVATVKNAFGDPIREYRAPSRGIVVGKSSNPVGPTGARILHLGFVAPDEMHLLQRKDCGLA